MNNLFDVIDELLKAYERTTPMIDQTLVDRVLSEREAAGRQYETLKKSFVGLAAGVQ